MPCINETDYGVGGEKEGAPGDGRGRIEINKKLPFI